eukprot:sb/3476907/
MMRLLLVSALLSLGFALYHHDAPHDTEMATEEFSVPAVGGHGDSGECRDGEGMEEFCAAWASRNWCEADYGVCRVHGEWMTLNCKRSCGQCEGIEKAQGKQKEMQWVVKVKAD